jgi:hypothetical protein
VGIPLGKGGGLAPKQQSEQDREPDRPGGNESKKFHTFDLATVRFTDASRDGGPARPIYWPA